MDNSLSSMIIDSDGALNESGSILDSSQSYSNIFIIDKIEKIDYIVYTSSTRITNQDTSNNKWDEEPLNYLRRTDPLLAAYVQLLAEGFKCAWRWRSDSHDQKSKELWIFDYDGSSNLNSIGSITQPLSERTRGTWSPAQPNETTAKVFDIFEQAMLNRVEWQLHNHQYLRIGKYFLKYNNLQGNTSKGIYSYSFHFFMRGKILSMHVVVQRNRLSAFNSKEFFESPKGVVLTPLSLLGQPQGLINSKPALLQRWKSLCNFNLESSQMLSVLIDGEVFVLPGESLFKLMHHQPPAKPWLNLMYRKLLGVKCEDSFDLMETMLLPIARRFHSAKNWNWSWNYVNPFLMRPLDITGNEESPMAEQPQLSSDSSPFPRTPQEEVQAKDQSRSQPVVMQVHEQTEQQNNSHDQLKRKSSPPVVERPSKKAKDSSDDFSMPKGNQSDFFDSEKGNDFTNLSPLSELDVDSWIQSTAQVAQAPMEDLMTEEVVASHTTEVIISSDKSIEINDASNVNLNNIMLDHAQLEAAPDKEEELISHPFAAEKMTDYRPSAYFCPPDYRPVLSSASNRRRVMYAYSPKSQHVDASKGELTYVAKANHSRIEENQNDLADAESEDESSESSDDIDTPAKLNANNVASDEESGDEEERIDSITPPISISTSKRGQILKNVIQSEKMTESSILTFFLSGKDLPSYNPFQEPNGVSASPMIRDINSATTLSNIRLDIIRSLSLASYDGACYIDTRDEVLTKTSTEFFLNKRTFGEYKNYISQLKALEILPSELMTTAEDPLALPIPSDTTVGRMLFSINRLLGKTFNDKLVGPLSINQWCQGRDTQDSPFILDDISVFDELTLPQLILGYSEEWAKFPPIHLNFWEKTRLEPYSLKKNVMYGVICPDNSSLLAEANSFFKELSSVYEVCNLGHHVPVSGGTSSYPGIFPVKLGEATNVSQIYQNYKEECRKLAQTLLEASVNYSETTSFVVYAIDPLTHSSSILQVMDCLEVVQQFIAEHSFVNVVLQPIPMHHILQHDGLLTSLKEIAFSIFTKSRRVSTNLQVNPALPNFLNKLYEPLYIVEGPNDMMSRLFHCCYAVSSDNKWLVASFTDERGEILETCCFSLITSNMRIIIATIWSYCVQVIQNLAPDQEWEFVIGKYGTIYNTEIEVWTTLLNSNNINNYNVYLISVEYSSSLQIIFPQVGERKKNNPITTFAFYPNLPCTYTNIHDQPPLATSFLISPSQTPSELTKVLISLVSLSCSETNRDPQWKPTESYLKQIMKRITESYHQLSWLTVTPSYPYRESPLPNHFCVAKRMLRSLFLVTNSLPTPATTPVSS